MIRAAATMATDIQPSTGLRPLDLPELSAYRELLYFLVWRDIKVRYKQTALGAAWAVLQPLMTMAVFSLFLGKLAHVPSDGLPYPLFSFAALVPWTYFAAALGGGAVSVVGSQHLISKVYFPRLLIPLAAATTPLIDLVIGLVTLLPMMWWYGIALRPAVLWLPVFVALAVLTAFGASLWLSTLNVAYRDVRYVVPFVLQFWMFATPVAYPSSLVPGNWRLLYSLNPMAGVIDGFRWALVGGPAPGQGVMISAAVAVLLVAGGLVYFRSAEGTFADLI